MADVAVPVWPPGTLWGVVRDTGGASVAGRVFVLRRRVEGWDGPWLPSDGVSPVRTDASGRYTVGGLEPGLYVVAVRAETGATADLSFAPTFAPATSRLADAVPVRVSSGETAEDTNLAVQLRRPIRVAGHLIGPPELVAHATVRLCPTDDASRSAGLCGGSTQWDPMDALAWPRSSPGATCSRR